MFVLNEANQASVAIFCKLRYNPSPLHTQQIAGTMVACSPSLLVIICSNPSQDPPLLMHVGK